MTARLDDCWKTASAELCMTVTGGCWHAAQFREPGTPLTCASCTHRVQQQKLQSNAGMLAGLGIRLFASVVHCPQPASMLVSLLDFFGRSRGSTVGKLLAMCTDVHYMWLS